MVADFVAHIGKKLPDDVVNKLEELGSQETAALPKVLYETMTKNQGLAVELNRPSCQDTGVLQFWLKCGTNFPYIKMCIRDRLLDLRMWMRHLQIIFSI